LKTNSKGLAQGGKGGAQVNDRVNERDAIAKADILIEAMGWIRRFRGKTTVIKLGGSLMEDRVAIDHILLDIIFMESVGMRPVRWRRQRSNRFGSKVDASPT
jgi:hypothetical protein